MERKVPDKYPQVLEAGKTAKTLECWKATWLAFEVPRAVDLHSRKPYFSRIWSVYRPRFHRPRFDLI